MVTRQVTNPAPQAVRALIAPADMLRRVVQTGKAVHTAALELVYSATAFILLVSHFKSTNEEGYMTHGKAVEYMEDQLREATGVKNRMLANYLDPARRMVTALTKSPTLFASTLDKIGRAKEPDDVIPILSSWLQENKDRRIESMVDLRAALGYSVPKAPKQTPLTADKALTQVENLMNRIEDREKGVVGAGRGKLQESALASAIVPKLKSKAAFIAESIRSVTELSELDVIDKATKDQRSTLKRLASDAQAVVKAKAKAGDKTKAAAAKSKARSKTQHTTA